MVVPGRYTYVACRALKYLEHMAVEVIGVACSLAFVAAASSIAVDTSSEC